LKPIFEEVRNGYGSGIVKFEEYDVDESSDVASKYNIRSVPTVIVEKNGQEVGRFAGVQSKIAYVNLINEQILK
jgi:thioredoxin 1